MPSPNQARVDYMLTQFARINEPVPEGVKALCDDLLSERFPAPAGRLPHYVLVRADSSESEWFLTESLGCDLGCVLVSGTLLPELTETEAADTLAASIAGYM
jgi:hypothetical protein